MKKFAIKKLEPITILPKARELQWRNLIGGAHQELTLKTALVGEKLKTGEGGRPKDGDSRPEKEEAEDNLKSSDRHTGQVAFNSLNTRQVICEELLRQGFLHAFHDFFTLTNPDLETGGGRKAALSEEQLLSLKLRLVHGEEELTQGNLVDACEVYMEVAEKYLEAGYRSVASYFFSKVIGLTSRINSETASAIPPNCLQLFVNAKLGLVRCLEEGRDSANALLILEEIYEKPEIQREFKSQVARQLIELYNQQGRKFVAQGDLPQALTAYEKCLGVCGGTDFAPDELAIATRVAEVHKRMGRTDQAIALIKAYLLKTSRLERELATKFELSSHKLLAECFEANGETEEAENSYRSFYELLKVNDGQGEGFKGVACEKLGDIHWAKEKRHEAIKFYQEFFEETLRERTKRQNRINSARVTLSLACTFEEFEDFMEYLQLSKNKFDDVLAYKKTRRLS